MGCVQVVHLVREANGIEPFADFLDSYRRHPAGVEHELALLFKGFRSERDAAPYLERAAGLPVRALYVDDTGFDMSAYRWAGEKLDASPVCFLNSYSIVLASGWLAHLDHHLQAPGVGLVGATGSWESAYSAAPRPLRPFRRDYDHFPNPHIRTNGFGMNRELLCSLDWPAPRRKQQALRLESGRHGISRQIRDRGLTMLVVGRDGVAYPTERWRESATYRSGGQANLLIADNRTRQYETASPRRRLKLEQMTWGTEAPRDADAAPSR